MSHDGIKWSPVARVDKYDRAQVELVRRITGLSNPEGGALARFCEPYETVYAEGNQLTTAGLNRLTAVLIGANSGTLDATRVRLGVGDSATAFSLTDVKLTAGTSQYFMPMDATYPQQSNGVATFKATFGDTYANFAWACWGLDVGTPTVTGSNTAATPMMNRKVTALGTKSSGTWVLTVTLTFS